MCSGDHKSGLEALDAEAAAALRALTAAIMSSTAPTAFAAPAFATGTPPVSLGILLGGYVGAVQRQLTARDAVINDLLNLIVKKDAEIVDHVRQRFGSKTEKAPVQDNSIPSAANDPSPDRVADPDTGHTMPDAHQTADDNGADTTVGSEATSPAPESGPETPRPPKPPRKPRHENEKAKKADEVLRHEPENLICAFCGGNLRIKGYDEVTRRLIVAAHMKYVQEEYAITSCDGCERVEQVPRAPNLFSGSSYDASVFAALATQKFAASTALYTIDKVTFSAHDELTRSWMSRLLRQGALKIADLWRAIRAFVLASPFIHIDETTLRVLLEKKGKSHRGYGFGIMADGSDYGSTRAPAVFFAYSPRRKGDMAQRLLKGFDGVCIADKFSGYLRFCKRRSDDKSFVRIVFCHAHARRNFEKIWKSDKSPIAAAVLKFYQALYAIEAQIRGKSATERRAERKRRSLPILREMRKYLTQQQKIVSQTGKLGVAIAYILDHFREFRRFCLFGEADIDNNKLERAIRRWAVTRRSSLFAGSRRGAVTWAIISSVVETCKLNGVDPYRYLTWYCRKKAEAGDAFDPRRHFPWDFKAHPEYATFNPNELPRSTMLKSQRLASDPPRAAA